MLKKLRKCLVVLFAVAIVASLAVIPVSARPLQGGVSDGRIYQGDDYYAYYAEAWAYCSDSPYWCYVYTTAGNSWDSGDPFGWDNDTARASVYEAGIPKDEISSYYITDGDYGCHC